jgi:hypothetical protein
MAPRGSDGSNMPLDAIRTLLATSDVRRRNQLITAHLKRLESESAKTQGAVPYEICWNRRSR